MCSVEGDIEEISGCADDIRRIRKLSTLDICRKCGEKAVILLQKKDPLCKVCFLEYCSHKFRSTVGKSKKIKHGDKILIAYSGGIKSTAMLHMVYQTLESASHKRLLFVPVILHINENIITAMQEEYSIDIPEDIISELRSSKYPVFYSCLEMVHRDDQCEEFYWGLESLNKSNKSLPDVRNKFCKILNSLKTLSAKIDYLKHLKLQLLVDVAKHAGCDHIFLGDSATDLAIQLLSHVALGRGSQISSDSSFFDDRYGVSFCRPMREFLNKEIALFNHLEGNVYTVQSDLLTKTDTQSSIQRLTEAFVSNLQESFPATIFTIFRTGGKLSSFKSYTKDDICIFCKSKLDNADIDCSALEALRISYRLSKPVSSNNTLKDDSSATDISSQAQNLGKDTKTRNFEKLCHGCSVTVSEIANEDIQSSLLTDLQQKVNRQQMKEEIKSFLLDKE